MPRMRRLNTRFYIAAVVFAVVLIVIRLGIVVSNNQLRDASELSEHSQQVLAASDAAQRLTLDLETGLRGWQLTGDREFLQPTNEALTELPARLRQLQSLVADDAAQSARVRELRGEIDDYTRSYLRPALRMDPSTLTHAERRATAREGKARLDAIRDRFDAILQSESQLASARAEDARDSSDRAAALGVA